MWRDPGSKGSWTQHKKHGDQFKVSHFTSQLPASIHGIRNYLGSGLVPGIGPSYAKKIVDHFGTQTLDIIRQESARLSEVRVSAKIERVRLSRPGRRKSRFGTS